MSAELRMVDGEAEAQAGEVDPLIGTTIDGRYEVESVLGEGGMGLVYKARHKVLNKPLAVKVLRPDVSRDEEIITRFRQEAQSASAIGNQHIIDISDFGVLPDGATYFIMEFLDGTDLTGAIERDERMDPRNVVHIAKQLCRALGAAHEAGIVHRDLKPDNIYLIRRGGDSSFVKVLDFGIAKVGGNSSKLTRAGQVFGTPHYMSPEQCAGSGVDHRTDVYALGVILYEMCTGECPFDADNLMGILTKHLYEEPTPPRQKVESIPEDLEAVILKAMAKQLDQRYQSMAELLEDLERVEAGVGTVAQETTRSFALETSESVAAPAESSGGGKGLLIAVVVLLIGGGVGGFFAFGGDGDPPVVANSPEVEPTPEPEPQPEPEVQPDPEPAGVEAPAAPETFTLTTEPVGAEVWLDGAFIGNTPIDVPKPSGSDRVNLEVKKPGFQDRALVVTSLSQDATLTLEAVRRPSSMRRPRMTEMATMMDAPAAMVEMVTMRNRPSPGSEVLNPWGD